MAVLERTVSAFSAELARSDGSNGDSTSRSHANSKVEDMRIKQEISCECGCVCRWLYHEHNRQSGV